MKDVVVGGHWGRKIVNGDGNKGFQEKIIQKYFSVIVMDSKARTASKRNHQFLCIDIVRPLYKSLRDIPTVLYAIATVLKLQTTRRRYINGRFGKGPTN